MGWSTILPLIIFFVIFYFLLIRPQQKRQKKTREMQSGLEKGDSIVTIGGIHGVVDVIEEGRVVIKTHGTTKMTFDRNAIREVTEKSTRHQQAVKTDNQPAEADTEKKDESQ